MANKNKESLKLLLWVAVGIGMGVFIAQKIDQKSKAKKKIFVRKQNYKIDQSQGRLNSKQILARIENNIDNLSPKQKDELIDLLKNADFVNKKISNILDSINTS